MLEIGPTTVIQIINFIVLLVALRALLWKPLIQALQERQQHIRSQIEEAEAINAEAKRLKTDYEKQITQAKSEAQKLVQQGAAQAERLKAQMLTEAKEEAVRIRQQAEREASTERTKAMLDVKRYLVDLTVSTASKVLQDTLDRPTQERMMSEFVRKMGEKYVN